MDLVLPDSKEKVVRKLTLWSLLSLSMHRRGEAPLLESHHFWFLAPIKGHQLFNVTLSSSILQQL